MENQKGNKVDKIYSRRRIILPKFKFTYYKGKRPEKRQIAKRWKMTCVIFIALITASLIVKSISPIIDKQCRNIAKSIATRISNEQASIVMAKYQYEDLCTITKDNTRQYSYDKC